MLHFFFLCFYSFFFNTSIFKGDTYQISCPNQNGSLPDFERLACTRRSFSRISLKKNRSKFFENLSENRRIFNPRKRRKNSKKYLKNVPKIIKKPSKMKQKKRPKKGTKKTRFWPQNRRNIFPGVGPPLRTSPTTV